MSLKSGPACSLKHGMDGETMIRVRFTSVMVSSRRQQDLGYRPGQNLDQTNENTGTVFCQK